MKNWTQEIIPLIKDAKSPLAPRLAACMPYFKEAIQYSQSRNLAGQMFESLNEYKYAKPFMRELGAYFKNTLSANDAQMVLALTPEIDHDEMYHELTQLRALGKAYAGNTDAPYVEALAVLNKLAARDPELASQAFLDLTRFEYYESFQGRLKMYLDNNAPQAEADIILKGYLALQKKSKPKM